MKIKKVFLLGIKGISERKFRTMLTIMSIVIGVAAIVALVSLVAGISASISHSLESIGPTTLYMTPTQSHIFTAADMAEIESLPYVANVIPIISFNANLSEAGSESTVTVYGIMNYSIASAIGGINLYSGRSYNDTTTPYALVGYDIAFPTTSQSMPSVALNQPLYLQGLGASGRSITVIPLGILNQYGSSAFVSPDSSIFIPLQAAESITNKYSYTILLVKAMNTSTVNQLYSLLENIYGNSARIISIQEIASTISSITGSLGILLGAVAGISLLVAGISILSIMMVSVTERAHEIGILKSIGFRRRDVMFLFLSEAIIIGFAGGIIGVALGAGGAYALPGLLSAGAGSHQSVPTPAIAKGGGGSRSFGRGVGAFGSSSSSQQSTSALSFTPSVSPGLAIMAIMIAIVVSVCASMYPAWKASTIDPIKALRSE